jgi:hypothetical protein
VVACVLDDIHIYDMFFCYLSTGALAGLVIACVLEVILIYDMFFCYLLTGAKSQKHIIDVYVIKNTSYH